MAISNCVKFLWSIILYIYSSRWSRGGPNYIGPWCFKLLSTFDTGRCPCIFTMRCQLFFPWLAWLVFNDFLIRYYKCGYSLILMILTLEVLQYCTNATIVSSRGGGLPSCPADTTFIKCSFSRLTLIYTIQCFYPSQYPLWITRSPSPMSSFR